MTATPHIVRVYNCTAVIRAQPPGVLGKSLKSSLRKREGEVFYFSVGLWHHLDDF